MKKALYIFFTFIFTFVIISCNYQNTNQATTDNTNHSFVENYKAPKFKNDKRAEKIKSVAPKLLKLMEDYAKKKKIPGISFGIVVDNELVVSSSTGIINIDSKSPAKTSSSFRIASMTKSFTAMGILKLRDEGKLSLEDPVSKFIPEMNGITYLTADAPTITIKNLLTMTAGFPEDNPWGDRQLHQPATMLLDLIKDDLSLSNVPSYGYEYSNTGYAMLGEIISRVSGTSYQSYLKSNVFEPLGMHETYWEIDNVPKEQLAIGYRWEKEQWRLEPMLHDGSYGAMGGLITSIDDFSKYVSLHLSAWPPRNDKDNGPVKRSSLREMQTPQFSRLYANSKNIQGDPCARINGYGYGLSITKECDELVRVSHGGALPGFGSNYMFFPEYGVGIMAFCNLTYTTPWPLSKIRSLLFDELEIQPRALPVSDILIKRKAQVIEMVQNWDEELEASILAENFYLDLDRKDRIEAVQKVFNEAGDILKVGELNPSNQLRGYFYIETKNGRIGIAFTLTPERDPKVQKLQVVFQKK
jgi:CubicO group peptidase (beta-lactamase class C family)